MNSNVVSNTSNPAPAVVCAHCANAQSLGPLSAGAPQAMGTCSSCGQVTTVASLDGWGTQTYPAAPSALDEDGDGI